MIPKGWDIKKLGDAAVFINGKAYKQSELLQSGKYKVLRVGNLFTNNEWYFSDLEMEEDKYVFKDDLMYAWSASFGPRFWRDEKTVYHYHIWKVKTLEGTSKEYLYYFLLYDADKILNTKQGGTMFHITKGDIEEREFIQPPLPEQIRIAEILSTCDTAIETTTQLIAKKEKRKKALMQKLLTGKVRFKEYKEEWEEVKFIGVADSKTKWSFTGGPFGSNLKASDYTNTGVRIIQLQNIGDGEFLDSYKIFTSKGKADELLSCNIYPNDIILSKMGDPVARACMIPFHSNRFLMSSDGIRLKVNEEKFNSNFVLNYINFDIFRNTAIEKAIGSTRKRIGLDDLKSIPFPKPSIKEQNKIAQVLSSAVDEIQKLKQQLDKLKEQKKGLMQVLLTGKIRVKI